MAHHLHQVQLQYVQDWLFTFLFAFMCSHSILVAFVLCVFEVVALVGFLSKLAKAVLSAADMP